jgi:hypothetical protein
MRAREYSTNYGNIDVLFITKDADIIIIETKLIRNPEAIRSVVAQLVGYIKSMSMEGVDKLLESVNNNKLKLDNDFKLSEKFISVLSKNISHGNIYGIIVGDDIHPNLLGLIDSIQSAPHLSFHLNLIKIESYLFDNNIIISAFNIESTKEIERSVINITIDFEKKESTIESKSPEKDSKGSKPILTWNEYMNNVNEKYRNLIGTFVEKWKDIIFKINMGTTGFSISVIIGSEYIPIQYIYDNYLYLLSEKTRKSSNIPDSVYLSYKKEIEKVPEIYDKHLISNKVSVNFVEMNEDTFNIVLNANVVLAKKLLDYYKENK